LRIKVDVDDESQKAEDEGGRWFTKLKEQLKGWRRVAGHMPRIDRAPGLPIKLTMKRHSSY
jgi:hypothetical protein